MYQPHTAVATWWPPGLGFAQEHEKVRKSGWKHLSIGTFPESLCPPLLCPPRTSWARRTCSWRDTLLHTSHRARLHTEQRPTLTVTTSALGLCGPLGPHPHPVPTYKSIMHHFCDIGMAPHKGKPGVEFRICSLFHFKLVLKRIKWNWNGTISWLISSRRSPILPIKSRLLFVFISDWCF